MERKFWKSKIKYCLTFSLSGDSLRIRKTENQAKKNDYPEG